MTVTDSMEPARPNTSCNSPSPTSYGRFPTYSFRPMTWTPRRTATFPIAGIGVGWMLSRSQAELQGERVTKARYAGGRRVRGNPNGHSSMSPSHDAVWYAHASDFPTCFAIFRRNEPLSGPLLL